jgi:lysine-specific demethylase/histidyl-hydroxylase NO66
MTFSECLYIILSDGKDRSDVENHKYDFYVMSIVSQILREQRVMFGKNLDVTSYSAGQRKTHNSQGRVFPAVLWDFYNNGCSVRLLNPQTFHNAVWRLCSTLQDHFGSMVGGTFTLLLQHSE